MHWTRQRAITVLILANVLWAGSYTAAKDAMRVLSPIEMNALRFSVAGLILLPVLWAGRSRMRIRRYDLPRLAMLCCLGFTLNKALEFGGLNLTTASDTALLIAAESMFTSILAWVVLRETIRGGAVGGLLVGVVGVYVVIERGLHLPQMGGGMRLAGDLLVLLALVAEAAYTIFGKASLARYPGLLLTATGILGSLVFWLPAAAVNVAVAGPPHMTPAAWLGVLYMAIPGTVVAYIGWMVALGHVDGASAAPTLFIQPLIGTVLAVVLLGERPGWATLAGGILIIAGVWIAGRSGSAAARDAAIAAEPLAG
jgi:drug/metabolite transporter (DMT)-like permease